MKKIIIYLFGFSTLIFAAEVKQLEKRQAEKSSNKITRSTSFMPGSFGVGLGTSNSSENMKMSKAVDFRLMYFPFKLFGFGAFYQYDEFKNINSSAYNAEQTQGGLEFLIKPIENPVFVYVGPFIGKGRFNRLHQRITIDDESSAVYGGILGASYALNDAFSVGPTLRYLRLNNAQNINTLSMKLEFQYRFVVY